MRVKDIFIIDLFTFLIFELKLQTIRQVLLMIPHADKWSFSSSSHFHTVVEFPLENDVVVCNRIYGAVVRFTQFIFALNQLRRNQEQLVWDILFQLFKPCSGLRIAGCSPVTAWWKWAARSYLGSIRQSGSFKLAGFEKAIQKYFKRLFNSG